MLSLFPGRTLEELDTVDVVRLGRAIDAKELARVEGKRQMYLRRAIPQNAITQDEWRQLREHDALLDRIKAKVDNGGEPS